MTLRRLGPPINTNAASDLSNFQETMIQQMKRFNDYMALMTNETSPPTEKDDTDPTT